MHPTTPDSRAETRRAGAAAFSYAIGLGTALLLPPEVFPEGGTVGTWGILGCVLLLTARGELPRWSAGAGVVLVALLYVAVQPVFAPATGGGGECLIGVATLVVAALCARRLHELDAGPVGPPAVAVVVAATAVAVLALDQVLRGFSAAGTVSADWEPLYRQVWITRAAYGRAFATYALPATLGAFLAMALPWTAWLARRSARAWLRWSGVAAAALQIAALVVTWSASAYLAAAAAGVVALSRAPAPWRRRGIAVVLAGLVVAAAGVVAVRGADDLWGASGSLVERWGNWRVAGRMVADRPWTGVGLGGFGIAYPWYRTADVNETRFAHNSYLQLLAEGGLAGAALAAAVLAALVTRRRRMRARSAADLPALCTLAAFAAHNLIDFSAYLLAPTLLAAFAAGTALAGERAGQRAAGVPARAVAAAAALVVGVLAFGRDRRELLLERARGEAVAGDHAAAAVLAGRAARWSPWTARAPAFAAEALLAADRSDGERLERAEREARRAVRLEPGTAYLRELRGRILLAQGRLPEALAAWTAAAELHPARARYRRTLRELEAQVGASRPAAEEQR